MEKREGFVMSYAIEDMIDDLTLDDWKGLMKAICDYAHKCGNKEYVNAKDFVEGRHMTITAKFAFYTVSETIKKTTQRWNTTCEKNAENVSKRWAKETTDQETEEKGKKKRAYTRRKAETVIECASDNEQIVENEECHDGLNAMHEYFSDEITEQFAEQTADAVQTVEHEEEISDNPFAAYSDEKSTNETVIEYNNPDNPFSAYIGKNDECCDVSENEETKRGLVMLMSKSKKIGNFTKAYSAFFKVMQECKYTIQDLIGAVEQYNIASKGYDEKYVRSVSTLLCSNDLSEYVEKARRAELDRNPFADYAY